MVEEIVVVLPEAVNSEIFATPCNYVVPVAVKLLVFKYVLDVNDSTSKFESKLTYKYPLKLISSYVDNVIVNSFITT